MDHLLNDVSPDDAADEVVIKNETVNVNGSLVVASQTLPYLATVAGVWISGRLRGGAKAAPAFGELRDY